MRVLSNVLVFACTLFFLTFGVALLAFAVGYLPAEDLGRALLYLSGDTQLRWGTGMVGLFIVFLNISLVQWSLNRLQREKTIAFDNPEGRVLVSLAAVEEALRRVAGQLPEVKELTPWIRARRRGGVEVVVRVCLVAETNFPETTDKLQGLIKSQVQAMLGLEGEITVRVHVWKVVPRDSGELPPKERGRMVLPGLSFTKERS